MPNPRRSLSFTSAPPKDSNLASPKPIVPTRVSSLSRSKPTRLSQEAVSNPHALSRSAFSPVAPFQTVPTAVSHSINQIGQPPLTPRALRHQSFTIMPSENGEFVPASLHRPDQDTSQEESEMAEFTPAPLARQDRKAFRRMTHNSDGSVGSPVYVEAKKPGVVASTELPPRSPSKRLSSRKNSLDRLRMAMFKSPDPPQISKRVSPRRKLSRARERTIDSPPGTGIILEAPLLTPRQDRRRLAHERSESRRMDGSSLLTESPPATPVATTDGQSPLRRIRPVRPNTVVQRSHSLDKPSTNDTVSPLRRIKPVVPKLPIEEDALSQPSNQAAEETVAPVRTVKSLLPSMKLNSTTENSTMKSPDTMSFLRRVKSLQVGQGHRTPKNGKRQQYPQPKRDASWKEKMALPLKFSKPADDKASVTRSRDSESDTRVPVRKSSIKKAFQDTLRPFLSKKKSKHKARKESSDPTMADTDATPPTSVSSMDLMRSSRRIDQVE